MSNMLRIGLIGCGERGASYPHIFPKTGNCRLTMAMDVNDALAQDVGKRFGAPWTTSLEEIVTSPEVDAVLICTPHYLHFEQGLAAVRAGKHLIVDKPLAVRYEDAEALTRAAREAGVGLSVFMSCRYEPQVVMARELIQGGAIGDLLGAILIFQQDKPLAYWKGGYTGRAQSDWRARWDTCGGGVLIHSAVHHVDWLRYVTGREVVEVSAKFATLDSPTEVEDTIVFWVRFDNGALGTVNASSSVRGTKMLTEFRVWGKEGHLSLTSPFEFYSLKKVGGNTPGQWCKFTGLAKLQAHPVEYLRGFAERIVAGEEPAVTADDGLAVQAIAEAAYRSSREGRPVLLEELRKEPVAR